MSNKINNGKFSGFLSLFTATFFYGFYAIFSRFIGFSIPLYFQSGIRGIAAAFMLSLLVILLKQWQSVGKKDLLWIFIRGFFGIMTIVAFFVAVNFLQVGTVYFIFFTGSTVGGYILGRFLFKEYLTPVKIVSLLLSLLGLYLIYSLTVDTSKALYVVISLVAGISSAFWTILTKKISYNYSAIQLSFLDCLIGGLMVLAISAFVIKEQWVFPTVSLAWGLNFLFACFYLVTDQLIIYGFRRLDAQIGSLVMFAEVVFGVILAFVFFKELITFTTLIGGLLIFTGIILPEINSLNFNKMIVAPLRKRTSP